MKMSPPLVRVFDICSTPTFAYLSRNFNRAMHVLQIGPLPTSGCVCKHVTSLTCSCTDFKNSSSSSSVWRLFSASMWARVSLSKSCNRQKCVSGVRRANPRDESHRDPHLRPASLNYRSFSLDFLSDISHKYSRR